MTQYQVGASPTTPYATASPSPSADESQASLTFLVANPQVAERLGTVLGGKLTGIQRSKMEETTASDGTKRWKISFTGKPMGDSYGK